MWTDRLGLIALAAVAVWIFVVLPLLHMPPELDTLVKFAQLLTPTAAVSATVALIALIQTRKKSSAETYFRIEEKFYHTDLMRNLRKEAADDLLNGSDKSDAFDELGDFFDFVGIMLKQGALEVEMAHSSFYRRATAFWHMGKDKGARGHRNRWDEFEYLVNTLERHQAIKDAAAGRNTEGKLDDGENDTLLKQERKLPSLKRWRADGTQ
jgi:hypothetical protein